MCGENQKSGFKWQEVAYAAAILLLIGAAVVYGRQPKVGVLNLKIVATELGAEKVMRAELIEIKKAATVQGKKLGEDFNADVERFKERIAQAESEDEKMSLRRELADIEYKTRASVKRIEMGLVNKRDEMVEVFHAKLKPSIDEVARKHGIDLVIDSRKEAGVLFAHPRVDLTSEVIKNAQAKGEFKNLSLSESVPADAADETLGESEADLTELDVSEPVAAKPATAAPVVAKPAVAVPADEAETSAAKKDKSK